MAVNLSSTCPKCHQNPRGELGGNCDKCRKEIRLKTLKRGFKLAMKEVNQRAEDFYAGSDFMFERAINHAKKLKREICELENPTVPQTTDEIPF